MQTTNRKIPRDSNGEILSVNHPLFIKLLEEATGIKQDPIKKGQWKLMDIEL